MKQLTLKQRQKKEENPIRWVNRGTTYVDTETGEELTKHKFKNYVKERKETIAKFNELRTSAEVWYIIHGRRRPQLSIEYGDS